MSVRTSTAIAVSILSLSTASIGFANADTSNLVPLEIDPVCVVSATNMAYWNVNNKNSSDVSISWTADDNGNTGSYTAPANTTNAQFATYYDANDPNNTTTFTDAADSNPVSRNTGNNECQPGQITVTNPTSPVTTDPGSSDTNPGSSDTPIVGGMGGGDTTTNSATTAATPVVAKPQLADTGASRVLPYTAAAIIALFTVATSALVRKNIL